DGCPSPCVIPSSCPGGLIRVASFIGTTGITTFQKLGGDLVHSLPQLDQCNRKAHFLHQSTACPVTPATQAARADPFPSSLTFTTDPEILPLLQPGAETHGR